MQSTAIPPSSTAVARRARPTDLPALVDLENACFVSEVREPASTIRRSLQSPHQEVWMIEVSDKPVGALILRLYKHALRVYSVAVHPDAQGTGLGGQLMRLAEQRAAVLGKPRIILEVRAKDEKTHAWYRKMGYSDCGILPGYYANAGDGIKMTKFLPPHSEISTCR